MCNKKVPCHICTSPTPATSRRYGGLCCNACAAFFTRSIADEESFVCKSGTNACLKEPWYIGKGCRKCRFKKCLEIGMVTTETIEKSKKAKQQAAEEANAKATAEKYQIFAQRLNSLLSFSTKNHNLVIEYLQKQNASLFNLSFDPIKYATAIRDAAVSERESYLTFLFTKYPIAESEFPAFCFICICNLEFKTFPEQQQVTIKFLQHFTMQSLKQIHASSIEENRFEELSNISQRFLNLFNAFF